ncbi:methyltransferase domain-containing protein [Nocardioides sp. LHD-245]|uniref:class I SAM-dependent methyltransferase n=1 Tax=Nocardioides sp. LHD-245 TaxID=3051387 RepID=UPI0027E06A9C|nr:methyltransferase domain-containing protein [Nocardioides sp. LHD-245]
MRLHPSEHPRLYAAARAAAHAVNTPIAKRRMASAAAAAPRPIRLEIGGLSDRPGWLVVNVNARTRNYLDATERWPFEDGALDVVYADNMIEHVPLEAGRRMFAEAHRCLRPGGVIRLVTPDLGKHVELYLAGSRSVDDEVGGFYRSLGLTVEHPTDLVRVPIASFGHHTGYLYDVASLCAELTKAGFTDAREWSLSDSQHEALRGLDKRTGEGGAQMAIEAVR